MLCTYVFCGLKILSKSKLTYKSLLHLMIYTSSIKNLTSIKKASDNTPILLSNKSMVKINTIDTIIAEERILETIYSDSISQSEELWLVISFDYLHECFHLL